MSYASCDPFHSVSDIGHYSTVSCSAESTSSIDLNRICRGCGNAFQFCFEYCFRDVLLHSVLGYFERVGDDLVTNVEIKRVYYKTFLLQVKAAVLQKSQFWETEEVGIPSCMESGSFKEAIALKTFNAQYKFLMIKRVINIQNHIVTHVNATWAYTPGNRIVIECPQLRNPLPDYRRDYDG